VKEAHLSIIKLKGNRPTRLESERFDSNSVLSSTIGKEVFLFEEEGNYYLHAPFARTCCRISPFLQRVLEKFDGGATVHDIMRQFNLQEEEFLPALHHLCDAGIISDMETPADPFETAMKSPVIPVLTVYPQSACNLQCQYCHSNAPAHLKEKALDLSIYEKTLEKFFSDIFATSATACLFLHGGGEPTLDKNLFCEIVEIFEEKCRLNWIKPLVKVTTNGTFHHSVRRFICDHDIECRFSLDGSEEVQNLQRPFRGNRESYKTVIENIRALAKGGRRVEIRSTVTAYSLPKMLQTVELAAREGIQTIHFEPLKMSERAISSSTKAPDPSAYSEQFYKAFIHGTMHGVRIKGKGAYALGPAKRFYCGACGINFVLTSDGNITACTEIQNESEPGSELFLYGKVDPVTGRVNIDKDKTEFLAQRSVENMRACDDCFIRYNCAGDCPLSSYVEYGSMFDANQEWCSQKRWVNKKVIAWLFENDDRGLFTEERLNFSFAGD